MKKNILYTKKSDMCKLFEYENTVYGSQLEDAPVSMKVHHWTGVGSTHMFRLFRTYFI